MSKHKKQPTKITYILVLFGLLLGIDAKTMPTDSLRLMQTKKKTIIQHTVKLGETLYSLLRKYECNETTFKALNPNVGQRISVGQVLKFSNNKAINSINTTTIALTIAEKRKVVSGIEPSKMPVSQPISPKIHTVGQGQTLFSIAKLYAVKVEDLKAWNTIPATGIARGQVLSVSKPTNADTLKVKKADSTSTTIKPIIAAPLKSAPLETKVSEKGIAEVLALPANLGNYTALHRTARVGTLIRVRNTQTNQHAWVRVVGKLTNSNSLLQVSPKVLSKLGGRMQTPVEINYIGR